MPRPIRWVGFTILFLLLLALPLGDATVLLALAVAVDIAALLAVRQAPTRASVVMPIGKSGGSLYLRRRTVPELRMHRPGRVVEAQARWRQASEAHRRIRRLAPAVSAVD